MDLYISEIREFVRARIDELAADESDMLLDEMDDRNLNATIDRSVEEAIVYIHRQAPVSLMEGRVLTRAGLGDCVSLEDGVIDIDLSGESFKGEVLRLVSFKAEDSCIKLTAAHYEDSPMARMQLNRYVRGKPDDPALVQMDDSPDLKPHYRYYTTWQSGDRLSFVLRYFPYPRVRLYSISLSETRLSFGTGGGTRVVHLSTEIDWNVVSVPEWVTVSAHQGAGSCDILVTVGVNSTTIENMALLEFVTVQGSAYLEIEQNAVQIVTPGPGGNQGEEPGGNQGEEPGGNQELPFLRVTCEAASDGVIHVDPVGYTSIVQLRVCASTRLAWTASFTDGDTTAFYLSPPRGRGVGADGYTTADLGAATVNDGVTQRNATLTFSAEGVDDVVFTVRQLPALTISPASIDVGADGGTALFSYVSGGNWAASQVTTYTGVTMDVNHGQAGTGEIGVAVPANTDVVMKQYHFKIEGLGVVKPFFINQAPSDALHGRSIQFTESSGQYPKAAGTYTVELACTADLATSDVAVSANQNGWITLGALAKDSPTTMQLTFSLAENTGNERSGGISVSVYGQEDKSWHSVYQEQGVTSSEFMVNPVSKETLPTAHRELVEEQSIYQVTAQITGDSPTGSRLYANGILARSITLPPGRNFFDVFLGAVSVTSVTTIAFTYGSSTAYCTFTQVVADPEPGEPDPPSVILPDYYISCENDVTLDAGAGSQSTCGIVNSSHTAEYWETQYVASFVETEILGSDSIETVRFTARHNNFSPEDYEGTATIKIKNQLASCTVKVRQRCACIEVASEEGITREGAGRDVAVNSRNGYAWEVSSVSGQWLTATKASQTVLRISAEPNPGTEVRTCTVILSLTRYPLVTRSVNVTQAAEETVEVPASIQIAGGGSAYVSCREQYIERLVMASGNWAVDTVSLPEWITVRYYGSHPSLSEDYLRMDAERNTGPERTGAVRVYLSADSSVDDELTITQGGYSDIAVVKDNFAHQDAFVDSQDARPYEDDFDVVVSPSSLTWEMTVPDGLEFRVVEPDTLRNTGDASVHFAVTGNGSFTEDREFVVSFNAFDSVNVSEVVDNVNFVFHQGPAYFSAARTELTISNTGRDVVEIISSESWCVAEETELYHLPFTVEKWVTDENDGSGEYVSPVNGYLSGDPTDPTAGTALRFRAVRPPDGTDIVPGTYAFKLRQVLSGRRLAFSVTYAAAVDDGARINVSNEGPVLLYRKSGQTSRRVTIMVQCNVPWTAESSDNWINADTHGGEGGHEVAVHFDPLLIGEERTATYVITAGSAIKAIGFREVLERPLGRPELER